MKLQELFEEASAGIVSASSIAGVRTPIGGNTATMIRRLGITSDKTPRLSFARNRKKPLLKLIQ